MPHRPGTFDGASRSGRYRMWQALRNPASSSSSEEELGESEESDDNPDTDHDIDFDVVMNETGIVEPTGDPMVVDERRDENSNSDHSARDTSDSDVGDESSSDSSDEDISSDSDIEDENDQPLYDGAVISLAQSVLAILVFALRHRITGVCFADLLHLISMLCPRPNRCLKTLYRFKKFFVDMKTPLIRHYYCSVCFGKLKSPKSQCEKCPGTASTNYFLEISMLHQLQTLYRRPGFHASLNHRFERRHEVAENVEDIYDGEVYRLLVENGFLDNRSNISLTWNTDGVSLFKSSSFNIWPLYFMINELPYHVRTKKENLILAGIWFGKHKPQANLFLETFRKPLQKLYRGVDLEVPGIENHVHVRGVLMCGTCDLPAKALVMNMKQYNGKFGCQKCKMKGIRLDNVRVYPYKAELDLRTTEEAIANAREAVETKKPVNGVKGPTILSQICHDFIGSTSIDVLHCVYLGVVKKLMTMWFDAAYKRAAFSLHSVQGIIDKRIIGLSPPSMIQRRPRKIAEVAYWKGSEMKVWILYYSIPILHDLMHPSYFEHHKLLVFAVSVLNQASISLNMINDASQALNEYVAQFENLYGLRNMTCNLHLLLHLPDVVKSFGPLWVTSCFPFEDANGMLKNLVHGTRYAQLQIASTISMFMNIDELKSKFLIPGSDVQTFCDTLGLASKRRRKTFFIRSGLFIVGKPKKTSPLPISIQSALTASGFLIRNYTSMFTRILKTGVLYASANYTRLRKYNSSYVVFDMDGENRIGIVQDFIKNSDCACDSTCQNCDGNSELLAILVNCNVVNTFKTPLANLTIDSIFLCHRQLLHEEMIAVKASQLKCVCFHVKINSELYVIKPVNTIEFE